VKLEINVEYALKIHINLGCYLSIAKDVGTIKPLDRVAFSALTVYVVLDTTLWTMQITIAERATLAHTKHH